MVSLQTPICSFLDASKSSQKLCCISLFKRSVWACSGVFCNGIGMSFDTVGLEMDEVGSVWKFLLRREHKLEVQMFLKDLEKLIVDECFNSLFSIG